MHKFKKTNPSNDAERMMVELIDGYVKVTEKMMRKNENKVKTREVLSAMQGAVINYLSAITKSCADYIANDRCSTIDYFDTILRDVTNVFEDMKVKAKSVDLN